MQERNLSPAAVVTHHLTSTPSGAAAEHVGSRWHDLDEQPRDPTSWAPLLDVRLIASTKTARSLAVGDSRKDVCSCALCDNTLGHFGGRRHSPPRDNIYLHACATVFDLVRVPGSMGAYIYIRLVIVSILIINRTTCTRWTRHRCQISSPNSTHGKGNRYQSMHQSMHAVVKARARAR